MTAQTVPDHQMARMGGALIEVAHLVVVIMTLGSQETVMPVIEKGSGTPVIEKVMAIEGKNLSAQIAIEAANLTHRQAKVNFKM